MRVVLMCISCFLFFENRWCQARGRASHPNFQAKSRSELWTERACVLAWRANNNAFSRCLGGVIFAPSRSECTERTQKSGAEAHQRFSSSSITHLAYLPNTIGSRFCCNIWAFHCRHTMLRNWYYIIIIIVKRFNIVITVRTTIICRHRHHRKEESWIVVLISVQVFCDTAVRQKPCEQPDLGFSGWRGTSELPQNKSLLLIANIVIPSSNNYLT